MKIEKIITDFEKQWETRASEIIVLGEDGSVRRVLITRVDDELKYIG